MKLLSQLFVGHTSVSWGFELTTLKQSTKSPPKHVTCISHILYTGNLLQSHSALKSYFYFLHTVVPLLKASLTRGHHSYEARIFCPHYYKVNRFLPLAKGYLSYVATMCSQIGWPYKRGTTVLCNHTGFPQIIAFTILLCPGL